MKNLFVISVYTILQTIKKKAFIISNIIIAVFLIIFFVILGQYLEDMSNKMDKLDNVEIDKTPVILLDNTGIFGEDIYEEDTSPYLFILISDETIQKVKDNNMNTKNKEEIDTIEGLTNNDSQDEISFEKLYEEIKKTIQEEELTFAISIQKNDENIDAPFNVKFLCNKEDDVNDTEKMFLTHILETIYKENTLRSAKIDISEIKYKVTYDVEELANKENFEGAKIIALTVAVLLFLAIYLYGHAIASSISSEKMSRIIETLVTSTKPRLIVIGKTIGMGILGLVQLVFLVLVAIASYKVFIPTEADIVTKFLETININTDSIAMMFVFFMLGYSLYAFSFAVVGAIISKTEDIQIANMPISIISLVSFYLAIFTMDIPNTSISKFASFFPFSSAFAIPAKMVMGSISIEEVYLAIIILTISIIFTAFCAIRIYSNIILNYGNKVKFKDLFNIFMKIQ